MTAMSPIVRPKIAQEIPWVSSRLLIRSFSIISADYRERAARLPPSLIAPRPPQRHPEQPRLFRQCGGPRRHGVCGLQRATLESTAHYRNGLATRSWSAGWLRLPNCGSRMLDRWAAWGARRRGRAARPWRAPSLRVLRRGAFPKSARRFLGLKFRAPRQRWARGVFSPIRARRLPRRRQYGQIATRSGYGAAPKCGAPRSVGLPRYRHPAPPLRRAVKL